MRSPSMRDRSCSNMAFSDDSSLSSIAGSSTSPRAAAWCMSVTLRTSSETPCRSPVRISSDMRTKSSVVVPIAEQTTTV